MGCPLFSAKARDCLKEEPVDFKKLGKLGGNNGNAWSDYVATIDGSPYPCIFVHAHMTFTDS